jgi:serine/threonine-protein phosphatase 2B catalytic subunit
MLLVVSMGTMRLCGSTLSTSPDAACYL